jgi:hypothetical protein
MPDLYIYYQVQEADAGRLLPLVAAMQAMLAARYSLAPQLKRRPQAKDGLQTWMEVYPATPVGFEAALEQAVVEAGLLALLASPRHLEVFTDLVSPCV